MLADTQDASKSVKRKKNLSDWKVTGMPDCAPPVLVTVLTIFIYSPYDKALFSFDSGLAVVAAGSSHLQPYLFDGIKVPVAVARI